MKCRDPCPGSCGQNADCTVFNHLPACTCANGYSGDPFSHCNIIALKGIYAYNFNMLDIYLKSIM